MNHRSQLHEELMYGRPDRQEAAALIDAYRAEVLAEAVEAARSEYLHDQTGDPEDEAYNRGVTDAAAAIGALLETKETRS